MSHYIEIVTLDLEKIESVRSHDRSRNGTWNGINENAVCSRVIVIMFLLLFARKFQTPIILHVERIFLGANRKA